MRIQYCTDGSEESLEAARLLADLPFSDSQVSIVTVASESANKSAAEQAVNSARGILASHFATLETEIRVGHSGWELVRRAEKAAPDLIVLGSRGRSGLANILLGSVAEHVARHARVPVLVARGYQGALDRVVVASDGSESSEYAAQWLKKVPLPANCHLDLVTVLPQAESLSFARGALPAHLVAELRGAMQSEQEEAKARLERQAAEFSATGKQTAVLLRTGHPAGELLDVAEERRANLVVVGAQGQSALDRFLLGSVSARVLRYARCSVLVVKNPNERPE
jgi:nucleotide-binding universal stress UspA family protein